MLNAITIKDVKTKLGELCKQKRQSYEMSQEELAEALDLSRYTIQKFENGKNATIDTILKIANHFDLLESFYQSLKDLESKNDINSMY